MKIIVLLIFISISTRGFSQTMILHDPISARVFSSERYSGINGSPFLYEKWMAGSVTVDKGVYNNLELKLDAYSNKLYFNKNDELYEFDDAVRGFTLKPIPADSASYLYFRNGFSGDGLRNDQFVQVIAQGKIALYKSDIKLLTEVNEINKGRIKTFGDASRYYLMADNKIKSFKLTKTDVMELVKDKESQLQAFIDQNKLSTKKTSDLILILRHYNTL